MAITTAMCNSFKQELLGGIHDLDTDTLRVALIKASHTGTYGASTTNYSDLGEDEVGTSGTGYSRDQSFNELAGATITLSGSTAFVDFTDKVFTDLTVSARGCLIYNASQGDKAIALFDFGQDVTSTAGDFTVVFPTADASNAVIRIS